MDVFQAIIKRSSIRKYLDAPVEWDKISRILDAGRLAPSAGNVQEWKFIVITDEDMRKAVAEAALKQYWMAKAPVIILICADIEKIKKYYGIRGERLYSIQDCAIAGAHMMLAAQALGLGCCWVGAFEEGMVQRAVGLPDILRPQILLTIGYPDEKPAKTPRLRLENMVYLNGHGNVHRIKDVGFVLWDYNVVGRAVDSTKQTLKDLDKITKPKRESIAKKLKEKRQGISKKLKQKTRR